MRGVWCGQSTGGIERELSKVIEPGDELEAAGPPRL